MKANFDGYGPAAEHAERESKKQQKEMWVLKSIDGGLHYSVITDLSEKKDTDKILAHYDKGQIATIK